MTKNLIIKTSYSKLPDGSIKTNFGDLIRSTILIECIGNDFLWLTDSKSIPLLKYFIDEKKILNLEEVKELEAETIYNLDNYISESFNKIRGNWRGYIWDGKVLTPENKKIESITPPYENLENSWQQTFIESFNFKWKKQDYPLNITQKEKFDIGFNWHVNPEWKTKQWHYWKELEKELADYSISWQEGLDNFEKYIKWLSSCRVIITCETLGLHLASALRKKIIAIVGPLDGKEYHYNRISFIKPKERECMPCNLRDCKFKEPCLNEISTKEIINVLHNN
ncbi:MAG: hypothetical protein KKG75_04365 [Nanoarchaeota archaeon]|nr:hypothetical protein [Nanoarchaeota archaeon]